MPRPQFAPYFDQARAAGLHSVPHAGETTGPETIWHVLRELRAERIGHGTSAVGDPHLLDHLAEHRIPLEVCPTSNLATGAVAGVVVTVNSDDPPMFATTLNSEYDIAAQHLDLDEQGVAELARTAVRSSFLEPAEQDRLIGDIDGYAAGHRSELRLKLRVSCLRRGRALITRSRQRLPSTIEEDATGLKRRRRTSSV